MLAWVLDHCLEIQALLQIVGLALTTIIFPIILFVKNNFARKK
ncbi:hypothetical protein [Enterococcus faecalis]|nr:hypothetical protein [Enterococcus faecalis]